MTKKKENKKNLYEDVNTEELLAIKACCLLEMETIKNNLKEDENLADLNKKLTELKQKIKDAIDNNKVKQAEIEFESAKTEAMMEAGVTINDMSNLKKEIKDLEEERKLTIKDNRAAIRDIDAVLKSRGEEEPKFAEYKRAKGYQ